MVNILCYDDFITIRIIFNYYQIKQIQLNEIVNKYGRIILFLVFSRKPVANDYKFPDTENKVLHNWVKSLTAYFTNLFMS